MVQPAFQPLWGHAALMKVKPWFEQLRDQVGNLVFRHVTGRLVVSSVPDLSRRRLSAEPKAQGQRFNLAVRHAGSVLANQGRAGLSMGRLIREHFQVPPAKISQ